MLFRSGLDEVELQLAGQGQLNALLSSKTLEDDLAAVRADGVSVSTIDIGGADVHAAVRIDEGDAVALINAGLHFAAGDEVTLQAAGTHLGTSLKELQKLGVDAVTVAGGAGGAAAMRAGAGVGRSGLIAAENARLGTTDWMLTKTAVDPATKYRCPWIEGFASRTSVAAGQSIRFFVSTNPVSAFRIEIFRMGYYGGAGGRLMQTLGPFAGVVQPEPEVGPRRLRECCWEACAELVIPDDWVSGVYVGRLTAEREGWQSYLIFIVRDERPADLLFQCADTTWQAYNRWPDQFALYDDGREKWYCGPEVDVSFDRPYGRYCQIVDAPLSTGSGSWFLWEYPFAYWLEQQGYDEIGRAHV